MIINLPFFNELNSDSLTDYYEVDIDLEQKKIQLDINFNERSIESNKLLILKSYLNDLPEIIDIAKKKFLMTLIKGMMLKNF